MNPRTTAVVAVHWQQDIVKREGAFGEFYAEMVERTGIVGRARAVLASARELGVPIFYTRVCFGDGYQELVANNPLFELTAQKKALLDGSPGAAIVPELAPRPDDVVINHTRVAATHGTNLIEQLRARDITSVAILGVSTNVSVESTATQSRRRRLRCLCGGGLLHDDDPGGARCVHRNPWHAHARNRKRRRILRGPRERLIERSLVCLRRPSEEP